MCVRSALGSFNLYATTKNGIHICSHKDDTSLVLYWGCRENFIESIITAQVRVHLYSSTSRWKHVENAGNTHCLFSMRISNLVTDFALNCSLTHLIY